MKKMWWQWPFSTKRGKKKFVSMTHKKNSSALWIMKRFVVLGGLCVLICCMLSCTTTQPVKRKTRVPVIPEIPSYYPNTNAYKAEFDYFKQDDQKRKFVPNMILFVGSSTIRLWSTIEKDLAPFPVLNRGFGGAQIPDTIYYFDKVVKPHRPRLIMYYTGANDIASGKKGHVVFEHFKIFLRKVEKELPGTKVCFISVQIAPSRTNNREEILALNALVSDYTNKNTNLLYLNILEHTLNPDGSLKMEIWSKDNLHMNQTGYALWTKIIKDYLQKIW